MLRTAPDWPDRLKIDVLPAHEVGHQLAVADVALDDPDAAALERGGLHRRGARARASAP